MPTIPRPSSRTLNEFVFQIITIIAGILIALWVDGIVEARREAAVVRAAHTAIAREIAENAKSLNGVVTSLDALERQLQTGLRFAHDMRTRGKTDIHTIAFNLDMPPLSRASWQTAERTGALGYMDFADVKAYAEIYDVQEFVSEGQRQQITRIADVTARLFGGEGGDPYKMRPEEVEAFRVRVLDALGALTIHKSVVQSLAAAYERAPKR